MTRDELIERLKELPTNCEVVIIATSQDRISDEMIDECETCPITGVWRHNFLPKNIIQCYDQMTD